jgi:hypothetical protein
MQKFQKTVYTLFCFLVICLSNISLSAQTVQDFDIRVEKATGKIQLVLKSTQADVTNLYQIALAEVDIHSQTGEYIASLQADKQVFPTSELNEKEELRLIKFRLLEVASNKIIECDCKGVKISLK